MTVVFGQKHSPHWRTAWAKKHLTPGRRELLANLLKFGHSKREASKLLGYSETTIYKNCGATRTPRVNMRRPQPNTRLESGVTRPDDVTNRLIYCRIYHDVPGHVLVSGTDCRLDATGNETRNGLFQNHMPLDEKRRLFFQGECFYWLFQVSTY